MKELEAIQFVHSQMLKSAELPNFNTGDTIVVTYKITEGEDGAFPGKPVKKLGG